MILISAIIFSFIQSVSSFAADTVKYVYDDLNRLIRIEDTTSSKVVEYQYDEVGNRTAKISYGPKTITASAGANGSISPSGAIVVPYKASQLFSIVPVSGYEILNILVDGISVGYENTYLFSNVTTNRTISASFQAYKDPYQIGATYYATLQAAYNAASSGATIKAKAKTYTENLNVNRNISISIEGGYNPSFTGITGSTKLKGKIQTYAGGGTITIKNFELIN